MSANTASVLPLLLQMETPKDPQDIDSPTSAQRCRDNVEASRLQALKTWQQAELALRGALRETKQQAVEAARLISDQRKPIIGGVTRPNFEQDDEERSPRPPPGPPSFVGNPEIEDRRRRRAEQLAAAREAAPDIKQQANIKVACEARARLSNHRKRKLRAKIVDILLEIQRRQALDQQEAKLKGDAPPGQEPGMGGLLPKDPSLRGASPRRTHLLEELTLEELELFRKEPRFFLSSTSLDPDAAQHRGSPSAHGSGTSPRGDGGNDFELEESLQQIADFFTPTRHEKDFGVSVEQYARRLRSILLEEASIFAEANAPEPRPPPARPFEDGAPPPLERMPCQGRRPAASKLEESPTLTKVQEVYRRKEEADAQWLEHKRQTVARRVGINHFRALEQQREIAAATVRQREVSRIRLMEAEERKARADASKRERCESLDADFYTKMVHANNKAIDAVEARRARITEKLEGWEQGVRRAELRQRWEERARVQKAEERWEDYMGKLYKLSEKKHATDSSQAQKNDRLRTRIHGSIRTQLQEKQKIEAERLAEEVDHKLAAARERRHQLQRGARYNLLERAFGSQARDFDCKTQAYYVDRRRPAWQRSAAEFAVEYDAGEDNVPPFSRGRTPTTAASPPLGASNSAPALSPAASIARKSVAA